MLNNTIPKVAICYDFDGTLSPGNMQEYGFFSGLGEAAKLFWQEAGELARQNYADPILSYMKLMIDRAYLGKLATTRDAFRQFGSTVELYNGVDSWFDRIVAIGAYLGLEVEHYIVSSGLKEMIEGVPIAHHFKKIYACSFIYGENGKAIWPAVAVNYTTKTQFIFRINKGIEDDNDHVAINAYTPETARPVPFSRMIYIGDGATDIPSMKLVKNMGGMAVAVYPPNSAEQRQKAMATLIDTGRADFISSADYSTGGYLETLVKTRLEKIAADLRMAAFKTSRG